MSILFVIILFSFYLLYRTVLAYHSWDAAVLTFFSVFLHGYLMCVLHLQRYLFPSFFAVSVILCLSVVFHWKQNEFRKILGREDILTVISLAVFFGMAYLFYGHYRVLHDAEFEYYIISIRQYFLTDSLGNGSTAVFSNYGSYTPLQGIIVYLFMKSSGMWTESLAYISNYFVCLVCCMPFLKDSLSDESNSQKITMWFLGYALRIGSILLFPMLMLGEQFRSLTPESLIGVVFGYALLSVWNTDVTDCPYYLRIALSLSVLILLKAVAIIMVLVCIAFLLMIKKESFIKSKYKILGTMACPFVFLFIWKCYCLINDLTSYLHTGVIKAVNIRYILGMLWLNSDILINLIRTFAVQTLHNGKFGLTCAGAAILCALTIVATDADKIKKKNISIAYFVGLAAYSFSVAYLYLFVLYGDERYVYEAANRYMGGYMPGLPYVLVTLLLSEKKWIKQLCVFMACILLTNWTSVQSWFVRSNYYEINRLSIQCSDNVKRELSSIDFSCQEGEKICVIYSGNMYYLIEQNIRYQFVPAKTMFLKIEWLKDIDEEFYNQFDSFCYVDMGADGITIENCKLQYEK